MPSINSDINNIKQYAIWYNENIAKSKEMREQVGQALWNYRHTLAKYVPPDPKSQFNAYKSLISDVASFPCHKCRDHGLEWLRNNKFNPKEENIETYTCRFHNAVSQSICETQNICKPIYNCKTLEPLEVNTFNNDGCIPEKIRDIIMKQSNDSTLISYINKLKICDNI